VLLLNKENPDKFYSALTKTGTASPATLFRFLLTHYKKGENKCFNAVCGKCKGFYRNFLE